MGFRNVGGMISWDCRRVGGLIGWEGGNVGGMIGWEGESADRTGWAEASDESLAGKFVVVDRGWSWLVWVGSDWCDFGPVMINMGRLQMWLVVAVGWS